MQIISRRKQSPQSNRISYSPFRSMFEDLWRGPAINMLDDMWNNVSPIRTSADLWEEGNNIQVQMAVPGLSEEDIDIDVDGDTLTISGSKRQEDSSEDKDKRYFYRSLETAYEQTFKLPARVDAENSSAELSNGVLKLTLPKLTNENSRKIKIGKRND